MRVYLYRAFPWSAPSCSPWTSPPIIPRTPLHHYTPAANMLKSLLVSCLALELAAAQRWTWTQRVTPTPTPTPAPTPTPVTDPNAVQTLYGQCKCRDRTHSKLQQREMVLTVTA